MTPELTAILGQLGIAAVFVVAWFRSEAKRDEERQKSTERYDKLQLQYMEAQTAHRREMLELIRDIAVPNPIDRAVRRTNDTPAPG